MDQGIIDAKIKIFYSDDRYVTITIVEDEKSMGSVIMEACFECNIYDNSSLELVIEFLLYRAMGNSHADLEDKVDVINDLRINGRLENFTIDNLPQLIKDTFRIAWLIENSDKYEREKDEYKILPKFMKDIRIPPSEIRVGNKIKVFDKKLFAQLDELKSQCNCQKCRISNQIHSDIQKNSDLGSKFSRNSSLVPNQKRRPGFDRRSRVKIVDCKCDQCKKRKREIVREMNLPHPFTSNVDSKQIKTTNKLKKITIEDDKIIFDFE